MDEQTNMPEFSDKDKRETSFHNFDEQHEIVGQIKAISDGTYGPQITLSTENGEVTLGTYEALKHRVKEEDIGKWIKIVCKGNVISPKTKRNYKDFDVFVK